MTAANNWLIELQKQFVVPDLQQTNSTYYSLNPVNKLYLF